MSSTLHEHIASDGSPPNDLLTPVVLMRALESAGTRVCEPNQRFHLDIPANSLGRVLP